MELRKIVQINLQHKKAATAAFCKFMVEEDNDLALIQDPWIHKGSVAGLGGAKGKLIYSNSINNTRTRILVRNGMQVCSTFY